MLHTQVQGPIHPLHCSYSNSLTFITPLCVTSDLLHMGYNCCSHHFTSNWWAHGPVQTQCL